MPSKKKKYNARFPAGRIKKIMQTDEEVGKVAQAVPVIISRTLELFVGSLLTKTMQVTSARNAKTLSPSHMKQCILSEQRFDFLKDLVKSVQDTSNGEDETAAAAPSLLTSRHNKYVHERRKSNTIPMKVESAVKQETVIKNEDMEEHLPESSKVEANCSTRHLNPGFYSEINPEDRVIKQESVIKHVNKEEKQTDSSKIIPNCSTRHLTPGFYSEINPEDRISKQETIIKRVDKEEQQTGSSKIVANCSSLHLNPGFYSEINPEQRVSVHQPPVEPTWYRPQQHSYPDPASPVLVMDEDYDT